MLTGDRAFSGFGVDDLAKAKEFYGDTLGLTVRESRGFLFLSVAKGAEVLVYTRPGHKPAEYTILNFPVDDVEKAVDELVRRGVRFERYDDAAYHMDERGIAHNDGPLIAWFKDPAGNILSVLQE